MTNSTTLAKSVGASPKFRTKPDTPPRMAVTIPIRYPPNAVAKKTAGKYGVKKTSGRSRERHHRAAVDAARQDIAKPMPNRAEGPDVPCQPCRNSSINFAMRHINRSANPKQGQA